LRATVRDDFGRKAVEFEKIGHEENSVMDFQSKRQGISKFWMKRNLKKQKKTFLRRKIVFIKFLTG
jgi:hypothetical protein